MMRIVMSMLTVAVAATPVQAQGIGDQISQMFKGADAGCNPDVSSSLTEAIRAGIDAEVKRAEAALKLPESISQLGCLDDLFSVNLDTLITLPNINQILDSAVSGAEDQLCGFAQEAWGKVTEPLTAALQLPTFDNLGIPGFDGGSSEATISIEAPQPGFGSRGQVFMEQPYDMNEGSTLQRTYRELYGEGQ
ncbi:hypothetical protein VSX64_18040 [Aurantimonas sp. C2-6-R+9]|uniref:hypothetical protein n=1 Tax=unclassified Aurantimonas TaxID=2638230 RepID=UPI002E1867E8|nr:hypothetical protein [Aurantimonas sp. C2-6-R+9]